MDILLFGTTYVILLTVLAAIFWGLLRRSGEAPLHCSGCFIYGDTACTICDINKKMAEAAESELVETTQASLCGCSPCSCSLLDDSKK